MKPKPTEIFFDELIHDHLLSQDTDELHDRLLLEDKVVSPSLYALNTTCWD